MMMVQGYNFTDRVRQVLVLAREQASDQGHEWVAPDHILLALLAEADGIAGALLANLRVDLAALRGIVQSSMKRGTASTIGIPDLPYTSKAKKVLEFAMSEAQYLNHTYVGTEHLLLGVLRGQTTPAAQALQGVGVTLERARFETLRLLGSGAPGTPTDSEPPDQSYGRSTARLALIVAAIALAVAMTALVVALAAGSQ